MRWDNLFDDLESQLEQGLNAEEVDLRAEEERLRLGRLSVRDRLRALQQSYERGDDYAIRLVLPGAAALAVRPATIGKDWMSADIRDGAKSPRQCIVPLHAISGIVLTAEQVRRSLAVLPRETESSLAARLGIAFVLRDLCRRRAPIQLATSSATVFGTIDRVGRDHLDLAEHEPGTPRRESAVTSYRIVPFGDVVMLTL